MKSHNLLESFKNISLIRCRWGHIPGSVIKSNAEFFNMEAGRGAGTVPRVAPDYRLRASGRRDGTVTGFDCEVGAVSVRSGCGEAICMMAGFRVPWMSAAEILAVEGALPIPSEGAYIRDGTAVPERSGVDAAPLSAQILSADGEGFEPTVRRPAHGVEMRPHRPLGHPSGWGGRGSTDSIRDLSAGSRRGGPFPVNRRSLLHSVRGGLWCVIRN